MIRPARPLFFYIALLFPIAQAASAGAAPAQLADQENQGASVEELVRSGRALLHAGEPDRALPLLEQADALSGGALATRIWLIRCWIARGHINDALDATDELRASGETGAPLDYLYGMALHARAKEYIALRIGGGMIEMNFRDAVEFLGSATAADAKEYGDAFLPLAEAAWHEQDLELARSAAERALALRPAGFEEALLLGRVAFSQYVGAAGDEARGGESVAHWDAAHAAFTRAIESAGTPAEPAQRSRLADCHLQLAYTCVWKQRADEASLHFSKAMALDPSVLDYRSLWNYFEPLGVLRCLERGARGFQSLHPAEATGDAPLLWWLGWANLNQQFYPEAEQAFARAVAKEASYADGHYYMGLARYHQQEFDGAVDAIVAGCKLDLERVLTAAKSEAAGNLSILAFLVDRCASAQPPRNLQAAILAELYARSAEESALFWSYAGLFYRDAGDELRSAGPEQAQRRSALYEKALAGYTRALELAPDHPNYLNDTAVVLHYCLERDLDRARALYQRAFERAEEELARTDLSADLRELYTIARRDSRDNLARLAR